MSVWEGKSTIAPTPYCSTAWDARTECDVAFSLIFSMFLFAILIIILLPLDDGTRNHHVNVSHGRHGFECRILP